MIHRYKHKCRVYTVAQTLTLRHRMPDFVLHRWQSDINQSGLQLQLTHITSQEQRASLPITPLHHCLSLAISGES